MSEQSESGMNNPDHISESLETIFWVKYLNFLMRIQDPEWKKFGSYPGWEKFGSGINIPDPQHYYLQLITAQVYRHI